MDNTHPYVYTLAGRKYIYANVGFFEETLAVRVSKNIVSGIGGGNSYIYHPLGFDVNYVAENFLAALQTGNFVGASVVSNG